MIFRWLIALAVTICWTTCMAGEPAATRDGADARRYDTILRGGTLYDGRGRPGVQADVAILGDRIAAIGDLSAAAAKRDIDVRGLAVAPGFINMLSWATVSLLVDGRSLADIKQGVTLEVFGEGVSMGPLNARMKKDMLERQGDLSYDVPWTTLGEYLEHLERRGVSCNVASFLGATTVRINVLGYEDRRPTAKELDEMRSIVRAAMEEGALGIGSSLIYAPAFYADTDELIAMCKVASEYDGMYISHMRSEGNQLVEAVEELIKIAREAGVPAEIYHLKAAGKSNWPKRERVVELVEAARAEGLRITADMYVYTAGATGLNGAMPPWVQEGGLRRWIERMRDPATRRRVALEMRTPTDEWENLLLAAGSPAKVLLVGFKNPALKHLTGQTLADVAARRGTSPEETAMDLVIEDNSRVDTVYFMMDEADVKRNIALPWVSFGSDAASPAAEGPFLLSQPHPRTYGNFARLLGKYVREEKVIPLEEAIRKLTGLPAANLGLADRGLVEQGYLADVVVFDPATIQDRATYAEPHQYATGMRHVFVNGTQVLADGEHTGAKPGRAVWGRGARNAKLRTAGRAGSRTLGLANCVALAGRLHLGSLLVEQLDPLTHVMAVVVKRAAAHQVAVDHARLVDERAAADFQVELALGHRGHPPPLDATGPGGDFYAVADGADGLVLLEEVPGDAQQVFVLANVLGGPAAAEKNAHVLGGIDVGKRDVGLDRVTFPFLGDRPAGLYFVQHHLVAPLFGRRHHGHKAVFLQAIVGVQRVDRLGRVAHDDQHFVHDFSRCC